jgi:histidine triad (HIT) family protein
MNTIFSRIISGEIPAAKVYEDEQTLAFLDIRPAARGHVLVVPKEEYTSLLDMPVELVAAVARTVQIVATAIMHGLRAEGFTVVQNDGTAAGQTVFHYHVHISPRWQGDSPIVQWIQSKPEQPELQAVANQLKQHIAQ